MAAKKKKTASTKKVVKNVAVSRKSTNRQSARPADAGQPPAGPINKAALEGAVRAWVAKPNKRASDYCSYPQHLLMADAKEMAQGRQDLPVFKVKKTPITVRDFDWLDLMLVSLHLLGDDEARLGGTMEVRDEDAILVKDAALAARLALARRAEACGIPLRLFALSRGYTSLEALQSECARAARMARLHLSSFNDREYALRLITDLEDAVDDLAPLVMKTEEAANTTLSINTRRAALKRLIYDCLTYLAPWGRDVTAGDPTRTGRYTLDQLFPPSRPKAPAVAAE